MKHQNNTIIWSFSYGGDDDNHTIFPCTSTHKHILTAQHIFFTIPTWYSLWLMGLVAACNFRKKVCCLTYNANGISITFPSPTTINLDRNANVFIRLFSVFGPHHDAARSANEMYYNLQLILCVFTCNEYYIWVLSSGVVEYTYTMNLVIFIFAVFT